MVLITQDVEDAMMRKLAEKFKHWGLNINFNKTKYLTSGTEVHLIIEDKEVKKSRN